MKTAARRSPGDRDRAIARLRALTIGSSIAGIAAVGGFGALAAASYDGSATGITTAAVTTDTSTADGGTSTTNTTTTQATAAPTTTTATAHAATGSS
jgi:hypothetical protein